MLFRHRIEKFVDYLFERPKWVKVIILITIASCYTIWLVYSLRDLTFEINAMTSLAISYIVFLVVGVITYFQLPNKKSLVLALYLLAMVGWSFKFVDYIFDQPSSNGKTTHISFYSDDEFVSTTDHLNLILYGNKRIILFNSKTGRYQFYNTDELKKVEYWIVKKSIERYDK